MPDDDAESRPHAEAREAALHRIADLLIVVVALAVAAALIWLLSDVLLLVFAAVLLACQLRGLALSIYRRTALPYGISLAVVLVTIGGGVAALSYLRGPRIVAEFHHVYEEIDRRAEHIWAGTDQGDWLRRIVERAKHYIDSKSGVLAGSAAGFVTSTIGNLGSLLLIVVAAIYLAASPKTYRAGLVDLLPR